MESQIEKFNRRKQKTEALRNKGVSKMTEEKKNTLDEQFTEAKKAWENAGLAVEDFPKGNSEETLKEIREKIAKAKEGNVSLSSGEPAEKEIKAPEGAAKEPEKEGKEGKEEKATETPEEENKTAEENKAPAPRSTIEVGAVEENPSPELDWIEEKRKFWKEYAATVENNFENDPAKDTESKTFSCTLSKDDKKGEIKYTAPDKVQIGKDSHLEMYSGLVKDAVKNNLSITFGATLDDKQKAMLLAACLMNKEKYQDGAELAMVNPPKIDMNAEYIKELPEDVQKTLGDYVKAGEEKARQEAINQKLAAVRGKLKDNEAKERNPESVNERYEIRKEQAGIIREKMTPEQQQNRQQKEEEREKIMAARLGIRVADMPEDLKKRVGGDYEKQVAETKLNERFTDKDGKIDTQRKDAFIAALKTKFEKSSAGK